MNNQQENSLKKRFAANFSSLIARNGVTQAEIAKIAGVPTSSMSGYVKGERMPGADVAISIAKALNVSVEALFRDPVDGQFDLRPATANHQAPILDVAVSAGDGLETYSERIIGYMPIYNEVLEQMGRKDTDGLCVVQCKGDSMEPKIADRSWVIIDVNDTEIREGVFAFRLGDSIRIKRLRRVGLKGIEAISENPAYAPEKFEGEVLSHFKIIGRAKSAIMTL